MVEFALLFGLLLMLALGAFEYGMVFRDSLTVTTASREGGRVAASTANHGDAYCVILEATAGALQSLNSGAITEVHIYRSSASGSYPGAGADNVLYKPYGTVGPKLTCSSGVEWEGPSGGSNWTPAHRVDQNFPAPWIGVRINYDHTWFTNFLWWNGTFSLSDDAVFRIEPPAP